MTIQNCDQIDTEKMSQKIFYDDLLCNYHKMFFKTIGDFW